MGRSKLRGIEVAGVKLAIEVPTNLAWQWPDAEHLAAAQMPLAPDVHVGVRVAAPQRPSGETFRYESRGVSFEIGWAGEDWVVAIEGPKGCERSARFDADFRHGEVLIDPAIASCAGYPLAHPLDELILLHRLIREGCVIVNASVSLRGGEALLFLEAPHRRVEAFGTPSRGGLVVLRPVLEAQANSDTRLWVYSTPWRRDAKEPRFARAPLSAIHVLDPAAGQSYQALSHSMAANEILQHVFAPMHDPDAAGRVFEIVSHVARRTKVVRMRRPKLDREISFNWDLPQAGLGFTPPTL
ncbi:MAG: hypothetical protein GY944_19860 [bacterium]|nr:hypothetical protein [bacterium]